ncbi:MAG: glycoside hydrolase family 3 N-terminal domain-containing protein [Mycobacterium sp.]|jgi:beta-N-acetylhexosaminidase
MSMPRTLCAVTALSGLLVACSPAQSTDAAAPPAATSSNAFAPNFASLDNPLPAAPAPAVCGDIASLSTRDKLAQLLMVGVTGAADAQAAVAEHKVGGIMIGSWTDLSMLGAPLAGIAGSATALPLGVSVDEEGGRVSRLASIIGSQPSARVLAETKSADEVYAIALGRGRAMRGLGITIDFAPVLDVTSDSAAIGDRSFGDDPAVVTEYAGAYARGLRDAGVLPVLKHFPGHGRAAGDSHTGSVSTPPLAELKDNDLVPYRTLTAAAPVAVMVGHMQVPGLTGSDPASLSPAAYGLLRSGGYGGPGFGGVVFTDDLSSMAAINARYGVAEAVLRSLQAGADVALWITTTEVPAVLDRLEQAVAAGELSQGAVDASLQRLAVSKGPNPTCGG